MRIHEDSYTGLEGVLEPGEQTAFGLQPEHTTISLNDPLQVLQRVDEVYQQIDRDIEAARCSEYEKAIVQQGIMKALALKDILRSLDNPAVDLGSWVPETYQASDWDY